MTTDIPATTLICVDCQYPALALRALRMTLAQCRYAAVKLLTDAGGAGLQDPRIEHVAIEPIATARGATPCSCGSGRQFALCCRPA